MAGGCRRAALVWHRRAGKDITSWSYMIAAALQRVGIYYYFGPTYAQAKKFLWDGMTAPRDGSSGRMFLSFIPPELIGARNETEMQLVLVNGSIIQLIGTDKLDSIRGPNPVGCVFSEYAVGSPRAWSIVEPMLLANGGWATFCYTPNGQNHGFDLWNAAKKFPDKWFSSMLTIRDTKDEHGAPIVSEADIDQIRAEGLTDEETIQQEYYCSFNGSISGAYYASQMTAADDQGRITRVPWEPVLPCQTWWDLGMDDAMTIWVAQEHGRETRLIDYIEDSGEGLPHYAKLLREKPYVYNAHIFPHDIEVRELATGRSRRDAAISLGLVPPVVVPKHDVQDGIESVRTLLARCWFDADNTADGIKALKHYGKQYDEEKKVYKKQPRHDWASHGADAFRTGAQGRRQTARKPLPRRSLTEFDVFA